MAFNGLNISYFQPEGQAAIGSGIIPDIDFEDYGSVPSPFVYHAGAGQNLMLAEWSGWILPLYSEQYTFTFDGGAANTGCVAGNGATSLVINGVVLVAAGTPTGGPCNPQSQSAQINLQAGVYYSIFAARDWFSTDFFARLLWQSPSQALQVVPQSQLFYKLGGSNLLAMMGCG